MCIAMQQHIRSATLHVLSPCLSPLHCSEDEGNAVEREPVGHPYFTAQHCMLYQGSMECAMSHLLPRCCFCIAAVIDGEIRNISLSDYRGKYVVLFFFPKVRSSPYNAGQCRTGDQVWA